MFDSFGQRDRTFFAVSSFFSSYQLHSLFFCVSFCRVSFVANIPYAVFLFLTFPLSFVFELDLGLSTSFLGICTFSRSFSLRDLGSRDIGI